MPLAFCTHFVLALSFFETNRKLEEKHTELVFSEMANSAFMWPVVNSTFWLFHRGASALYFMKTCLWKQGCVVTGQGRMPLN